MTSFDARLRLIGHHGLPLGVEIDLSDERMKIMAGDTPVADWALDEIRITHELDGFHIDAEGEKVVLSVLDPSRFAIEIGLRPRT